MRVERTNVRRPRCIQAARINELLFFLGLSRDKVYWNRSAPSRRKASFWMRNEGQLDFILRDARECYIHAIKEAHPDTNPHPVRNATDLNQAWSRIKKLFARRGATLD